MLIMFPNQIILNCFNANNVISKVLTSVAIRFLVLQCFIEQSHLCESFDVSLKSMGTVTFIYY
jgi:hypothetical protein